MFYLQVEKNLSSFAAANSRFNISLHERHIFLFSEHTLIVFFCLEIKNYHLIVFKLKHMVQIKETPRRIPCRMKGNAFPESYH